MLPVSQPATTQTAFSTDPFLDVFKEWQSVPYRFGGVTAKGIDCSAFVQVVYRDAWQKALPRTTASQSQLGKKVSYKAAQAGDLVFFKTSRSQRHVGVYLGNKEFMHASTSEGVIISRLDNPYWASRIWQFRRLENESSLN